MYFRWPYPIPIEVNASLASVSNSDVPGGELLVANPDSIDTSLENEIREESSTSVLHPHSLALAVNSTLEMDVGDGRGLGNLVMKG